MKPKFAPSLICMNFLDTRNQLDAMNLHADYIHADFMDLHFVKNMGLCPPFISAIHSVSSKPIDCHVMSDEVDWWIPVLKNSGASMISFHAEVLRENAARIFNEIEENGMRSGLVLSPETSVQSVEPYLDRITKVTVMTVQPGFPGAPFLEKMITKFSDLANVRDKAGLNFEIEADGSVSDDNIARLWDAGTDVFVVGVAALFARDPELHTAFEIMKKKFSQATCSCRRAWTGLI